MKFDSKFQLIFILVLTGLSFVSILENEFIFDDKAFVLNWAEIQDFKNFPSLMAGSVPDGHEGVYRPVRSLLYLISFKFFEKDPFGYHLQGIVIHLLCTALVYLIIKKLSKQDMVAFFGSLLFGVHPIHTEAISTIPASLDMAGVLFFFFAFYLYLKKSKWTYLWAVLAFLTYEITLVLPIVIMVYEMAFTKRRESKNYWGIALGYGFIRFFILDIGKRGEYLAGSFFQTMLVMVQVVWKYLLIMIYPLNLNVNHKIADGIFARASEVQVDKVLALNIFNLKILLPLILIGAIIYFSFNRPKNLISFGALWFFIGLLPVMNIIPQIYIFAERYLYLASFGYCLILGYVFYEMSKRVKPVVYVFGIVVVSFSLLTIVSNNVLANELTLWTSSVSHVPDSSFGRNGLGLAYATYGKNDLAILEFEKAINLRPEYDKPYNNLAGIYLIMKENNKAIEIYEDALSKGILTPKIYSNLGVAYMSIGNYNKSIENYLLSISLKPDDAAVHLNLGLIYYYNGQVDEAIEELETARDLRPDLYQIRATLGNIYQKIGRDADALVEYEKALEIDPNSKYASGLREEIEKLK